MIVTLFPTRFTLDVDNYLAALLYWLPLAFCAVGYTVRTYRNCAADMDRRSKLRGYYNPTDTLGTLIGRAVITLLPVGNLLAAVFDLGFEAWTLVFKCLEKLFSVPLVPDSDKYSTIRNPETVEKK